MILHQNVFRKNVDKKGKPTLDNDCDTFAAASHLVLSTCFVSQQQHIVFFIYTNRNK